MSGSRNQKSDRIIGFLSAFRVSLLKNTEKIEYEVSIIMKGGLNND